MSFVLAITPPSTVTCGHGPGAVSTSGTARLTVMGAAVLVAAGVKNASVAGCTTPTSQGNKPCKTVTSISKGASSTLRVDGAAVLLDTLAGGTDGMVTGTAPQTLAGKAGQTLLGAT